jgi:hydrogenase small subunit
VQHFCEVVDAWPIGLGHPCFGCTEQNIAFRIPLHQTVQIGRPRPPDTYPPMQAPQGGVSPIATGVAGAIVGGLVGAGFMASRKLSTATPEEPPSPTPSPKSKE